MRITIRPVVVPKLNKAKKAYLVGRRLPFPSLESEIVPADWTKPLYYGTHGVTPGRSYQ